MNCPKCKEDNPNDAYYCHSCGKKLKTKVNGWLICSIVFFISTILLGFLALGYSDDAVYYQTRYYQETNNSQKKDEEIERMKELLPQTYYTMYSNQRIYYWNGDFERIDYTFDSGVPVTIYTQKDGYGMTEWGWIPMNCLEKY